MSYNTEERIWITWWIIFCIRYSRLFWINLSTRIYINKKEKSIISKIKTGYSSNFQPTLETVKLLGSTKSEISKDENAENGENVPDLETTEVILVHCNIFNNKY